MISNFANSLSSSPKPALINEERSNVPFCRDRPKAGLCHSLLGLTQIGEVAKLAALGTWRYSQGIYRFQPDFFDAVLGTRPNTELPVEVLYRLPEWCIYIETPGCKCLNLEVIGFWCHLEWDVSTRRHELRLLLNTESRLIPIVLHLGNWTVLEATQRAISEAETQAVAQKLDTSSLQHAA